MTAGFLHVGEISWSTVTIPTINPKDVSLPISNTTRKHRGAHIL